MPSGRRGNAARAFRVDGDQKKQTTQNNFCQRQPKKLTIALCCPLQAALKKYQMEHKSKGESLEKCQAELKKLRRKSQGSKNPSKYGEKEMQVSPPPLSQPAAPPCCLEGVMSPSAERETCNHCAVPCADLIYQLEHGKWAKSEVLIAV